MFRKWLSGFIDRNKEKIELTLKICLMVAVIITMIYLIIFGRKSKENVNIDQKQLVYKPEETIISGKDVSTEQYEEDSNLVETFIKYCNDGKVSEAYSLLTDECKQSLYHTQDNFKNLYCDRYFNTKKEFNLQSWVKKGNTVTYQIRLLDDILSSGEYQSNGVYQDYITIVNDGENEKININGYIGKESINKSAEVDGINIQVLEVDRYMDYEEYTCEVANNTDNVITLDSMQNPLYTINLQSDDGNNYQVRTNSINFIKLMANPDESKKFKIQFSRKYTSENKVSAILFSQVVKNYNVFLQNQAEYNDFTTIQIDF